MTTVVLTSAALFCVHCMLQQDKAAALHPPMMYACVTALLLLPWDMAFKVVHACIILGCGAQASSTLALRSADAVAMVACTHCTQCGATHSSLACMHRIITGIACFRQRLGPRGYCCAGDKNVFLDNPVSRVHSLPRNDVG